MKKLCSIVLSLLLCFAVGACTETLDPTVDPVDDVSPIALLDTCSETVYSLSGTDALGRSISPVGSVDGKKYVGLFYFLWMGQEQTKQSAIYDNTKLLESLGEEYWADYGTVDSPADQYHFWGEPLFGYYNSMDTWVMRRHMEMLTAAGVDFLVFDTTNQFTFNQVWQLLLPIMEAFAVQGFSVPKIAFYTNTDSPTRVTELYNALYSQNLYSDLWFAPNGKPLMIANNISQLSTEVREFFDFRSSQWPGNAEAEDGFPWIDFNEEQTIYPKGGAEGGSIMSVSVAQHNGWPFSDSVQYKDVSAGNGITYYNTNRGRGYSRLTGVNDASGIDEGINFAEQWEYAISQNPSTVFVTGWNEWMAVKFYEDITVTTGVTERANIPNRRVFLVDTFNEEFSRDIEPMKGGYGDNYYMQLIENIRAYKGTSGEAFTANKKTIDINGDLSQWESVSVAYRDFKGDAVERNCKDAANRKTYSDQSNRNDIVELRVAEDENNFYFLITAAENITEPETGDATWMNLMIGTGTSDGFEGFDFVVNRTPSGDTTSIEKSDGGYRFTRVGEAKMRLAGQYLMLEVPKATLEIKGQATLSLKVTDHIASPDDVMDYYVSGDSAPIGRLSYSYKGI